MLSKKDKLRLAACIDVLKADIEGRSTGEGLDLKTQLWLSEKLKEIDDQNYQADQMLATALQVLQETDNLEIYLMLRGV